MVTEGPIEEPWGEGGSPWRGGRVFQREPGRARPWGYVVDALPDDAIDGSGLLLRRVLEGQADPDQAWVWRREWLEGLRQSLDDLAAGRTRRFQCDKFLASL